MIVAGVGCRRDCPAEEVVALVRRALAIARCEASALAVPAFRADEPGPRLAAKALQLPLAIVDGAALAAAQPRCLTHSTRAAEATGFASVAEAAALAAAGPGATLLLPRIAGTRATCALARANAP